MTLLFKRDMSDPEPLLAALAAKIPERDVRIFPDVEPISDIEYALVYEPPPGLLASLPNLKAIFSLWAGTDHMASDPALPPVPVIRMIDRCMTATMTVHVVQQVLDLHTRAAIYRTRQAERHWEVAELTAPWDRRVGFLGLGSLGRDAAEKLVELRFDVAGWSRSPKEIEGISCYYGKQGLAGFLARTDILVCLLPITGETESILNAENFARLPPGASIINCARGGHLVEADLLAALDSGQLGGAALDVFNEEPLPGDHPFWGHPKIVVTPHIAAFSAPETVVELVVENIERIEIGEPPLYAVDFDHGY